MLNTDKDRGDKQIANWFSMSDCDESPHDYNQDQQRFEGLMPTNKHHCQLLLDYAKENLCKNKYEEIDDAFDAMWDKSIYCDSERKLEALNTLSTGLTFIDKDTIYNFLEDEALVLDEEAMYIAYRVATPEGIYNED